MPGYATRTRFALQQHDIVDTRAAELTRQRETTWTTANNRHPTAAGFHFDATASGCENRPSVSSQSSAEQ